MVNNIYKFNDNKLNQYWRIHPSYKKSNIFQRLEFFGDKILSFILTSYLMNNQSLNEGDLSIRLSMLINRNTMAQIGKFLSNEIICTGELTSSMICDCLEVYIACIYMDGGDIFKIIYDLWKKWLFKPFEANYKNQLQEFLQARKLNIQYTYQQIKINKFLCTVSIADNNKYTGSAYGSSKKEASLNAAVVFYNLWKSELEQKYLTI